MEVFLGDAVNGWVKYFTYIYWNTITDSARFYCDGTHMREDVR
jgi:hypothetical protein